MNPNDARELALSIWAGPREAELPRLNRIDNAVRVRRPDEEETTSVIIPSDAPPSMKRLALTAPSNYLPTIIEVFRQVLRVEGYLTKFPEHNPMEAWHRNRFDARQTGIHDSALKYGAAYMRIMPGTTQEGLDIPSMRGFSPRYCTAAYSDPESDEWPIAAIYMDRQHLTLVDEEAEYVFGWETTGWAHTTRVLREGQGVAPIMASTLTFLERREHNVGVTPIVRYRDRTYLAGEEQYGIVEPLIVLQNRIDETNFEALVAQYYTAFRQRYVIGWTPESELEQIHAGAARVSYFDASPEEIRVGDWAATDPTGYIVSGGSQRRDLAAIAQVPAQVMGVDAISNVSDATLAGLEMAKNRKTSEIATSLGESHEQGMRLIAHLRGHQDAATEYDAEMRWAEREARSWAGTIDGLAKLVQSSILSPDTAVEMLPNYTDAQVERAKSEARRSRSAAMLATLRTGQTPTRGTVNGDRPRVGGSVSAGEPTASGRPDGGTRGSVLP